MASLAPAATTTSSMHQKILRTKAENARREAAEVLRRAACPFEASRRFLQQRGYSVYAHSVHVPGSTLFVVGSRILDRDGLLDLAASLQERKQA